MRARRSPRFKPSKRDLQEQITESNERVFKLENLLYSLAEHCKCYVKDGPTIVPFDPPDVEK